MAKKSGKAPSPKKTSARKAARSLHAVRFPNEGAKYRVARENLLCAEIELRRQIERVAAERRKLPVGGAIPEDYAFEEIASEGRVRRVRMSELFGDKSTLIAYSFMYGPEMAKPCPMCTAMLDSLNGSAAHVGQRTNLVVIAKSPADRIRAYARERGWNGLLLLSSAHNDYNRDYKGEGPDGSQWPSLNVFVRRDGKIHHYYHTEMLFAPADPGQHNRHVDMIWPLWNLFDFTPEGRGANWYPKLSYDA
jgi:predicted dithiol-disulfide oxidoreductase (DUF899 family)